MLYVNRYTQTSYNISPVFMIGIVYILAYLDRSNLANFKILQNETPDSLEASLGLKGIEFNWASQCCSGRMAELSLTSYRLFR